MSDPEKRSTKGTRGETRKITAFRILPSDLAEIDRRRHLLEMTRTEYMVKAALGTLPDNTVLNELDAIKQRLDRVERLLELGSDF